MFIERRDKEDNFYSHLQQQSLQMLQELSGKRWTDFNEHDPGVTIMDILNYNLLELKYQTEFDFEKYLASPINNELKYSKVGLLPANELISPCIVTPQDYESLIETKVSGVKKCKVEISNGNYYCISIEIEEQAQPETVIKNVQNVYHKHRNLCENLEKVLLKKISNVRTIAKNISITYHQETEKIEAKNAFTEIHTTLQNDFPDTYGINQQGLPANASELHRTKILQLKAYLLIFDYLLSAAKQQLGGLHQSLALSNQILSPFSHQIQAQDLEQLLDFGKLQQTEIFKKEELHKQKSAYLDMLDSLYGEDTSNVSKQTELPLEEENRYRAKLIRQLPILNAQRFRSFNLLDVTLQSTPGINKLMNALTQHKQSSEVSLENRLVQYELRLVDDSTIYNPESVFYEMRYWIDDYEIKNADGTIDRIPNMQLSSKQKQYYFLKKRLHFFSHNMLLQGLLEYGTNPENYLMKKTFANTYLLLYKHPKYKKWLNLGFFNNIQVLIETANLLWHFLEKLNKQGTSFYVVEHLLLSEPLFTQKEDHNVISLVFAAWRKNDYTPNYIQQLHERLPIHIEAKTVWLNIETFYRFEQHYYSWRKALAQNDKEKIQIYANAIKQLIVNN